MKRRTPLKRRTPVKPVNRTRKASTFARCYGSKARVAFVQSLPCLLCGRTPSDNAHLHGYGGMGTKGPYDTIIPLCRFCHRDYDEAGAMSSLRMPWDAGEAFAAYVESLWLRWQQTPIAPEGARHE